MRIARLDLTRYGRFTDRSLELPAGELDLHLVVGPNEAGKSTTRAALSELLFGIDARSSYAFLHDYKVMRVGARIERGEQTLAFQRRKGNKNTLLDPADAPLADSALAPFLGTADRAFFERMFSLDHHALVEGGKQLLEAKDDVGRMLFQASGGLARFGEVLKELDAEIDALWGPRRAGNRAYYAAHEQFEIAQRALKDGVVRVKEWKEKKDALEKAQSDVADALKLREELLRERARLERIKRVAPALAKRRALLGDLREISSFPLLPESAGKELQDATKKIAVAVNEIARLGRAIDEARSTRDAARIDEALIASSVDIRRAAERRIALGNHRSDIEKRQLEVHGKSDEIEQLVRKLGWERASLEELRSRIPSELAQEALTLLIRQHANLVADRNAIAEAFASRVSDRDELARNRDTSLDAGPPGALVDAVVRARKLGDADERRRGLAAPVQTSSKRLETARKKLWDGEIEALRAIVPPPPEDIEAIAQRLTRIAQATDGARAELGSAQESLARCRLEEQQIRRDARPVTTSELEDARARRDGRWASVRSWLMGETDADASTRAEGADELQRRVREADDLADSRFLAAEASAKLQAVRAEIEIGQQRVDTLEGRIREHDAQRADAERDLAALHAGLGVALGTPAQLRAWLERRADVLALAEQTEQAKRELELHDEQVAAATDELRRALIVSGVGHAGLEARTFAGLVQLATDRIAALEGTRKDQQTLIARLDAIERALPELQSKRDAAKDALERWHGELAARVALLGLAHVKDPEIAASALKLLRELDLLLRDIAKIERERIATMRRDLDEHAAEVSRLARGAAPDLALRDPMEGAQELERRLDDAEEAKRARDAADQAIERFEKERGDALGAQAQAEGSVRHLLDAAGVAEIVALHGAIDGSDRRRAIERELRQADENIVQNGDGRAIEELEREAASEDAALVGDRLATIGEELRALEERRDALAAALVTAKREYDAIRGEADAARAASERSEALSKMTDAVERYVRVRTARELLRWAIERYRREKQGPLLARASELFATLTLGELERLVIDYDEKDQPRLAGVRRDGSSVPIDGMSSGTADQLFLALRVAALEVHLRAAPSLPFVADDLLAHFDDQRAAAAFRVLGELARRTQVLFFTHHEHLIGVARSALGSAFHLVEL